MNPINRFFHSFAWAGQGILHTLQQEQNMRFHLVAALYVLYFSRFYDLQRAEKAVLYFTIGLVFAAELMNTAVEHTVNIAAKGQRHPTAKLAKDAAAGAVLAAAVSSVFVGICLFADTLVLQNILGHIFGSFYRSAAFIVSMIAGVLFIFYAPNSGTEKQEERK